ncbi:DUF2939 domain-containing protein [Solilutibacter tolerans]|uniref:DUF2939 domain-containing protein n=1 Tax=Solilutibacter tolerans TaxID=1604334 RepID=A0A1N6WBR0_9GAMM|nr:DUF2939 domain-containing protein [Lysobacter tolerans]SIQ87400.1 Protein of unknown function [Lysobacter tolerans]
MNKTARGLLVMMVIAVLAAAGWIAAGPYMAIHGIRQAIEEKNIQQLERHVDYPMLRSNVKAQIEDRMAREIGRRLGDQAVGGMASGVAGMLSDSAVDAMVSPAGIAVLLQGHALVQRASGNVDVEGGLTAGPKPYDPLKDAQTRFVSPSRFIATVKSADGKPVDFVFERQGLRWRLGNIVLPKSI